MKVKVLKTFLSGRYEGAKGETPDIPDEVARYLAEIGFVAPVQQEEGPEQPGNEEPEESDYYVFHFMIVLIEIL